jgi:hypothetical protein
MRHLLRCTILPLVLATLAPLVVCIPTAGADTSLQDVTLACSDGTSIDLSLDVATVSALTDAVNAMTLFPAGDPPLTCSVTQTPVLQTALTTSSTGLSVRLPGRKSPISVHRKSRSRTFSSANPQYDYAVGGGQAPNLGCPSPAFSEAVNFALSAHVAAGAVATTATGTFNVGSPPPDAPLCPGHFNSTVDCLVVTANDAHLTAKVTQATGIFSGLQGMEIDVWVHDNGVPVGVLPDMIDDGNVNSGTPCDEGIDAKGEPTAPDQPVVHGNISVHKATP